MTGRICFLISHFLHLLEDIYLISVCEVPSFNGPNEACLTTAAIQLFPWLTNSCFFSQTIVKIMSVITLQSPGWLPQIASFVWPSVPDQKFFYCDDTKQKNTHIGETQTRQHWVFLIEKFWQLNPWLINLLLVDNKSNQLVLTIVPHSISILLYFPLRLL